VSFFRENLSEVKLNMCADCKMNCYLSHLECSETDVVYDRKVNFYTSQFECSETEVV